MGKNVYTSEVKWAVVKETLAGNSISLEIESLNYLDFYRLYIETTSVYEPLELLY